jgi:hypothetical protein
MDLNMVNLALMNLNKNNYEITIHHIGSHHAVLSFYRCMREGTGGESQ